MVPQPSSHQMSVEFRLNILNSLMIKSKRLLLLDRVNLLMIPQRRTPHLKMDCHLEMLASEDQMDNNKVDNNKEVNKVVRHHHLLLLLNKVKLVCTRVIKVEKRHSETKIKVRE